MKILHFYDFGPNGNYWEYLKALRVVSRMPAGFLFSPKNTYAPGHFLGFFRTSENLKNFGKRKTTLKFPKTFKNIYWFLNTLRWVQPAFRFPPLHPTIRLSHRAPRKTCFVGSHLASVASWYCDCLAADVRPGFSTRRTIYLWCMRGQHALESLLACREASVSRCPYRVF